MVFRSKYGYKRTPKYYSRVDIVERETYIPLEIQYERLMLAGVQRDLTIANDYYYEYNDFVRSEQSIQEFAGENLHPHYMDKPTAFQLYRNKVDKAVRYEKQEERLQYLKNEYNRLKDEADLRKAAVNEYIAQQDKINKGQS